VIRTSSGTSASTKRERMARSVGALALSRADLDGDQVGWLLRSDRRGGFARSRRGAQLNPEVEGWAEVAVDEVSVGLERERRRVMTHPALQAQRTQAGLDEHRRARVAKRVEADTSEAGARGGGEQDAAAQAALVGQAAVSTGDPKPSSPTPEGRWSRSIAASSPVSGISRAPWRDFGATTAPLTTARLTCRCGVGPSSSRSPQRRPVASEIRSPLAASSSNKGRYFDGTSSSRRTSSARVR